MSDGPRRERSQVLRPARAAERIRLGRAEPSAPLATLVDYLWWVEWDTPEPYVQEVAPRPVVHLAAEWWEGEPRLLVHGVPTGRSRHELDGVGRTVAAAFRPGAFAPFVDVAVAELTGVVAPADGLLGRDDRPLARTLLDLQVAPATAAEALDGWLAELGPRADPIVEDLAALVERAERDSDITRAEQLAAVAGVSLRTLQRRFRTHVGVSPKWVVQRYRLLEVLERAHAGQVVDWAAVAAELGYADQSHLTRVFRSVVGEPPGRYRSNPPGAAGGAGDPEPR